MSREKQKGVESAGGGGRGVAGVAVRGQNVLMATVSAEVAEAGDVLTAEQTAQAVTALRQLHGDLREFLAAMPVEAQTASGLARFLGVERTTCQRVVSTVNKPFAGVGVAADLPGVEGLRLLTSAAAVKASKPVDRLCATLRKSVDEFEALVRRLGPTRSRLLKKLGSDGGGVSGGAGEQDSLRVRRTMFEAAAALTGRASETWVAVHIYEPPSGDGTRIVQTRAHGLLGHVARGDAVPLTFHVFAHQPEVGERKSGSVSYQPLELAEGVPGGVLAGFSSSPVPAVRTRQPEEFMMQAVEASEGSVDLMFGMYGQMQHPACTPQRMEEIWGLVNFPAKRMLLDVWLHRDLARGCIAEVDQHLWGPDFASRVGERWQTRFPAGSGKDGAGGHRLELLGAGLANAATAASSRHMELLRYLFEARGLDATRFVGYRLEVAYPVWRTGYRVSLDYGEAE